MDVRIKRVYAAPSADDGERILVDRLWPRGLTKAKADVALWLKDLAPSTELRKWFNHDPDKWDDFKARYLAELSENHEAAQKLSDHAQRQRVTLVYGARDEVHNEAVVLQEYFRGS